MILEVGEFYLNASKEIVKIDRFNTIRCRYYDRFDNEYEINGKYLIANPHNKDLIAHITKQLLNHLVVEVNSYHIDNEFKQMIDNVYGEKK